MRAPVEPLWMPAFVGRSVGGIDALVLAGFASLLRLVALLRLWYVVLAVIACCLLAASPAAFAFALSGRRRRLARPRLSRTGSIRILIVGGRWRLTAKGIALVGRRFVVREGRLRVHSVDRDVQGFEGGDDLVRGDKRRS